MSTTITNQISLFPTTGNNALHDITNMDNVIQFPNINIKTKKSGNKSGNNKKGEKVEVYPLKSKSDIENIKKYFLSNGMIRDYTLFVVGINTGLRCSDLVTLTWEKLLSKDNNNEIVDMFSILEQKTVHTRKQREFRDIYINETVKEALQMMLTLKTTVSTSGYIFESQREPHIEVDTFRKILKQAAKSCGIKVNIGTHTMRKTWGYHQMKCHTANGNWQFIYELQQMYGHRNLSDTYRYIGMTDERRQQYYHDVQL